MNQNLGIFALAAVVLVVGVMNFAKDPVSVVVNGDAVETVGGTIGSDVYHDVSFQGETAITEKTIEVTADYTLQAFESGATVYATGTGATTTLPTAKDGLFYKFVVGGPLATNNWIIDSAEGDNIEGALIVAGAVVDCAAEDQINFVVDGENLGDFVELRSDGDNWYLTQSNGLTAAKITCTDPD